MPENKENYQLYKRYVRNIALIYQRRKDLRAYIELLLSISVITIFSVFAIRPTIVTVIQLNREISEKEKILDALLSKLKNIDTAQTLYNQNKRTVALASSAVPDGPLPDVYSRQIEGLTKVSGVNLIGVTAARAPITPVKSEETGEGQLFNIISQNIEFSVDVSGSYTNVLSFLSEFEKMRRPMTINSMTIRLIDEDSNSSDVILSLSGLVPFIP